MNQFKVHVPLTPEQKDKTRKKVLTAWGAYWVFFFAMLVAVAEVKATSVLGGALVLLWVAAKFYLVVVVADAASRLGKSSTVWGGGTFVLGPLGALLLPGVLLVGLRR